MSIGKQAWSDVVQDWYDEVNNWRYGVGSTNGSAVGHFTQVVWYRSHEVGCAMAYCPNSYDKYFYVCQYCPPGNLQYARPYKSGSPCADCPDACDDNLCTNPCPYNDLYGNCGQLKTDLTCAHTAVSKGCPASCQCTTELV
ncbi:cysteine-rich venom protein-like [Pseudoliparis swirei]|uniref:cysteine-rich venom protein-like n=1 Tax=Pseudoliparis swirei TaxID=2059687 RepID=UPI0024BEDC80|nr:cysteine-rich venom protein-like [Pseudoliparis swirei]